MSASTHDIRTLVTRRGFLQIIGLGAAGFSLGWTLRESTAAEGAMHAFNHFVRVNADNTVTVVIKHLDKGQGVTTGLTTIVAEELDAAWEQMRWEFAPADASRYNNLQWGPDQGTGGSSSIANSWEQLRTAGAGARAMLVAAAAAAWQVTASEITVSNGVLSHANGKRATFGELAAEAAGQTPPKELTFKTAEQFTLIGKPLPRIDSPEKTHGRAQYTIDVVRPGMLTAVVAHPPRFGATLKHWDATSAKQIAGVVEVVEIPRGVAVLARDFWSARRGRDALKLEWDETHAERRSSAQLWQEFAALAEQPGAIARNDGDVKSAFADAAKVVEATYELPYLAHAALEPLNAVCDLRAEACEIWSGAQSHTTDQNVAAQLTGLKPEQIIIHTQFAGGSFGRRAAIDSDYISEAVMIAMAIKGRVPVKLQWTREDDMQSGRFRPMAYHSLRAGLDANSKLIAWHHRIVVQSFLKGTPFADMVKDGVDATAVEGARNLPYRVANCLVDIHLPDVGVPTLWWRSVGHSFNGFVTEAFLDEVAAAVGKDPVAFRRELLANHPRHRAVLDLAVAQAGEAPAGKNQSRGVAVHESFNSYVAQVADITVREDGSFKIDRVVCAVDCGIAINPDIVRAQMEGGIGMGLGAVLHEAITLKDGAVEQINFDRYKPLRIDEMPVVEVHIVPSNAAPSGVGEPGLPPIAPAVANALFALTGKPVRRLPFG